MRSAFRVVFVFCMLLPSLAAADAPPSDHNDIYYHCTEPEQCPDHAKMCGVHSLGAGRKEAEASCAADAKSAGLEPRCLGPKGALFCAPGARGIFRAPNEDTPADAPARGCSAGHACGR